MATRALQKQTDAYRSVSGQIGAIHNESVATEIEQLNNAIADEDEHGRTLYMGFQSDRRCPVYVARIGSFLVSEETEFGLHQPLPVLYDTDATEGLVPLGMNPNRRIYQTVVE